MVKYVEVSMKSAVEALEFGELEKKLFTYMSFEENVTSFEKEEMIFSKDVLEGEHSALKEAESFFASGSYCPLLHVYDLSLPLEILSKNGILTIKELADFEPFLDNASLFRSVLKGGTKTPYLSGLASGIMDFRWLDDRLSQAILPDLTLADDASENLYVIRNKLKKAQASLGEALRLAAGKYSSYLAEVPETLKSGLPSLAVKSDFKGRVPGMVADISNTGSTTFIVPIEVLDIQNKIFELKEEEIAEIEKIIKELSGLLGQNYQDLRTAYLACLRLDSLFGRTRFGLSYQGNVAEYGEEIKLEDLFHPLLNLETVVRNNFSLGGQKAQILVISGPNAGGKTVLIKAVALAVLMNQRGLLVPCRGQAVLPIYDRIFFLAGDSQSIMDSLSTFSGHVAALKEGLDNVDKDSLFIVDEIGQGTSPSDGEALGVAVIDYLKKIGCYGILTSHYDGIKQKAFEDKDCLIGAMVFDEDTIKPTFVYHEGMIGKSYALEVSANLGLNPEIIKEAKEYVNAKNKDNGREILEETLKIQQQNLKLKDEYEKKLKETEALSAKRERALEALTNEKEAINKKAEERIQQLVDEKTEELNIAYKEHKISLQQMAELKGLLGHVSLNKPEEKKNNKEAVKATRTLRAGDHVRVISLNNSGTITNVDVVRGSAKVKIDGIEIKTTTGDLVFLDNGQTVTKPEIAVADRFIEKKTGIPLELNLLGLRQDEARERLDKYLDDCLLMHFHMVRIIHGNGTGALRSMVQSYLKKNPNVASFRFGEGGEGGVGVTVVTLK